MAEACRGFRAVGQAPEWLGGVGELDMIVVSGLKYEPEGYITFHAHPRYRALLRKMKPEP